MVTRRKILRNGGCFVLGLGAIAGCGNNRWENLRKMTVGVVGYDRPERSLESYQEFRQYLSEQTRAFVELEPTFNELRAVEQVSRNAWSLVFAPPGLAAIAIARNSYVPLFCLDGVKMSRSVLLVRQESSFQTLEDLGGQIVALGQPGSATGYYLPLYDLYGLTLAEVRFSPTPKMVLEWLAKGEVSAGAISETEYLEYRPSFDENQFRVLHYSRPIPPGVVLLETDLNSRYREQIARVMEEASPTLIGRVGYIPNAEIPSYTDLIRMVGRVRPLEAKVRQKPAILTLDA